MSLSSDLNYEFHLESSKDINFINEYMEKSPTISNTQLWQSSDNFIEIQESYAKIQLEEGTITTVEEFNKNVPIIVNNNQIKDILAADINNTE